MYLKNQFDTINLDYVAERSFLTVSANITVSEAIALLSQASTDCVLVVASQLVGIFTEKDVVRLAASEKDLSTVKIAEVMTKPVITHEPTNINILQALTLMRSHQIRHLPIVDERGQVIGLVTQTSLMQAWEITELAESSWYKNQHFTAQIVRTIPEILYVFDLVTQHNVYLNSQITEVLGYNCQQVQAMGKALLPHLIHPDDLAQVNQHLKRFKTLEDGKAIEIEYRMKHANGEWRWLHSRETVFARGADGSPTQILGAAQDISDRKLAENKLRESTDKYRRIVETTIDGVWLIDAQSKTTFVSKQMAKMLGYTVKQMLGKPLFAFMDEEGQALARTYIERRRQGIQEQHDFQFRRQDGSTIWTILSTNAIFDDSGQYAGALAMVTDITARKQAEIALCESEEQLRLALDLTHTGSCDWQLSTGKMTWNDNHYRLLGLVPGKVEANYQTWRDRVHPDDVNRVEQIFYNALATNTDCEIEYRTVHPNGSVRYLVSRCRGIYNASGQPVRIVGMLFDITERILSEQKIAEQAALLDVATDAILVRDLNSQILFWNKGAEQLYGWQAAEVIGKNAIELICPDRPPQLQEALKTVVRKGEWQGELHKVAKDGNKIVVESHWTLVLDAQGKPKSILAVDTDITDKKQLQAQFLRAQRLESIGVLAGGIAHDLNNVLAPILMSIQLLQLKFSDGQSQRLLKILEDNIKRGAALVKQVLSFARGLEGDRTIVQVRHLIAEIDHIIKETFPKSITVFTDIASDLQAVLADATQLHQVLMNLVVNARDAMPDGGTLTIAAVNFPIDENFARKHLESQVGAYIKITVADTGTGIDRTIIERIFDPFFTTKEVSKGTGLGLSTVVGIIKSHGGFVEVESQLGKGSQFTVYLPSSTETAILPTDDRQIFAGGDRMVLVVDDEAAICHISKVTLESHNYRVLTANNGIEALALYTQYLDRIDVVLLDMMMPEMDGIATIYSLQSIKPDITIVAMSGLTATETIEQARNAGVASFLFKPFAAIDLLQALQQAIACTSPVNR